MAKKVKTPDEAQQAPEVMPVRFYPYGDKPTRLMLQGRMTLIPPEGYAARSEEEEEELKRLAADPRFHVRQEGGEGGV